MQSGVGLNILWDMINYDNKAWWRVFASIRGTVVPAVIVRTAVLFGFTLVLVIYNKIAGGLGGELATKLTLPRIEGLAHTILGVVLGLLIVFRTNSSYDRFWEGRKLWGAMVNTSRNLARSAAVFAGPAEDFARLIAAYVITVKRTLRSDKDLSEIDSLAPAEVIQRAKEAGNPPSILAYQLTEWVRQKRDEGKLDAILAAQFEERVGFLVDYQGGCERILKTPIPFVYAVHIKHLLFVYLVTLPFVLVPMIGWSAPLAVGIIAFGLLGIEDAGVEIEDPFGDDPNDLPLDDICNVITRDTSAMAAEAKR